MAMFWSTSRPAHFVRKHHTRMTSSTANTSATMKAVSLPNERSSRMAIRTETSSNLTNPAIRKTEQTNRPAVFAVCSHESKDSKGGKKYGYASSHGRNGPMQLRRSAERVVGVARQSRDGNDPI